MIYLDANATEPLRPEARDAALATMETGGNPSSVHQAGRAARKILEAARERVADLTHARPADVVFCAGATEANALAIHALGAGRSVLIGATEHDAIRAAAPHALPLPVHPNGQVDLVALQAHLTAHPGALVCLMAANNETGVLHDIESAAKLCAEAGALLHVDAVQAVGRCNQDWLALGAASFALSGHKFGGPPGAGALVTRPYLEIKALIRGGGQELGRRGGTPALPAIAGLAAALGKPYFAGQIAAWRDEIEAFCVTQGAVSVGAGAPRLPNTLCLALPGVRADIQLITLDMAGICVSSGSACSSGKVTASHVLLAMGLGDLAGQAIRVSLPWNAEAAMVLKFKAAYEAMARRALRSAPQSA
ncbi:cysteine desulfurase family protein [Acidocella aminolytica]|jgi:cysteine desulfurase|uniref:Cysteine desulfurase n=1 Tax=Acidocella aminolytica 101 = DSM 11237 TaxID=1120923 RepID=A0A0D6PFV3_9PROT|nr:cysteine desulfurase family protein [Acidocella aminolytica]GAN80236.1 cysteine desulfurase NifS/aminotransferase class V [Acidocella aminolytica 101 = DSM 11237]GBQ44587.1 cysteine desulfurase [Acidocella aminolytica 101 = DSM 11237]SHE92331.1 cysteine desulfurase [Acidocella aminolytica 101 = DSM 11237]